MYRNAFLPALYTDGGYTVKQQVIGRKYFIVMKIIVWHIFVLLHISVVMVNMAVRYNFHRTSFKSKFPNESMSNEKAIVKGKFK